MKKTIQSIGAVLAIIAVFYLMASFIACDFDIKNWGTLGRFIFGNYIPNPPK